MAVLKGREGSLSVGANTVAEIKNFTYTEGVGANSRNVMGSGDWDQSEAGRKNWSMDATCNYDPADTAQIALTIGDEVTISAYPEGDTTGNQEITGTARIEELKITADGTGDDNVEFTVKLVGNGAPTRGTVA